MDIYASPKARRSLQLIRKPDRDWNRYKKRSGRGGDDDYNSLENPIGIETIELERPVPAVQQFHYNSLENPIGIETSRSAPGCRQPKRLQLIRKPDRDWNGVEQVELCRRCSDYNSLENPIGIETRELENIRVLLRNYNSLENPIGIETGAARSRRRRSRFITTH